MDHVDSPRSSVAFALCVLLVAITACSDDSSDSSFPGVEATEDSTDSPSDTTEASNDDSDGADDSGDVGPTSERVEIDLEEFYEPRRPSESAVRARRVDDQTPLPGGANARARKGDFLLENDRIRVFVERFDEAMSPCPYGGNVVDGLYKSPDGELHGDIVGEVCPMLNVGLTLKPEHFEILRDGSETGVGVVAVTGPVALLDFLNLRAMAPPNAVELLDTLPFDPDEVLPLTMTTYYILEHGDSNLRTVTALRNDGDEPAHALFGHLVKSGGYGAFFNPLNKLGGFGYESLSEDNIDGNPMPYVAYTGPEASFAYVPEHDDRFDADLPTSGIQLATSGVAASVVDIDDMLSVLLATRSKFENREGLVHLDPGESTHRSHRLYLGTDELASVLDPVYDAMPVETGSITGIVRGTEGGGLEGVRVSAVDSEDRTLNQAVTDDDGVFSLDVPPGTYHLKLRSEGRSDTTEVPIEAEAGEGRGRHLELGPPGRLSVGVETPSGEPVPARVSVRCVDECPDPPTSQERDVTTDTLPGGFQSIEPTAPDGTLDLDLPPGSYRVYVSRGIEWSVWPNDAPETDGHLVELAEGDEVELDAEIARVVDTSGAIGGDYHVHGVRSADSVITPADRVMSFVSEGVEVLVSTDHDVVTDYRPIIEDLQIQDWMVGIPGDEITTADIGHFNGFPIPFDPSHRAGGALDWGRGPMPNMTPAELYDWVDERPGPQVIQVNHPASDTLGLITGLKADVLHGTTHADSSNLRLPGGEPDPETGDTGYWSDNFTALEVMNGAGIGKFWAIARWWMTMIGRGFTPTGTAVTDTHTLNAHLGGSPRTYAFVGDETDTPNSFDLDHYVETVNANRAVGTNGPFFRVRARNDDDDRAGPGSTIRASSDNSVTLEVEIDIPVWMSVDRIDLFSNVEGVVTGPGEVDNSPIEPTKSVPIEWESSDTEVVETGDRPHRHRTRRVDVPLEVDSDAYVIVVVRGDENRRGGVWPVVPRRYVTPFAFSNPIFVDADGNGYDDPPLADEAASSPSRAMSGSAPLDVTPSSPSRLNREQLDRLLESFRDPHAHTH